MNIKTIMSLVGSTLLAQAVLAADPVVRQAATAKELYAKIAKPIQPTVENMMAMVEVISYANEGAYCAAFWRALEAYRAKPGDADEVKGVNKALDVLIRNDVIPESAKIVQQGVVWQRS